jgi:hypothetical protein
MRVSLTYWGSPSREELLCSCCIGVVQKSNLVLNCIFKNYFFKLHILKSQIETDLKSKNRWKT